MGLVKLPKFFSCMTAGLISTISLMTAEASDVFQMKAGFGISFEVQADRPWSATGIMLQKGEAYEIQVTHEHDYRDSYMRCNANGPKGLLGWLFDRSGRSPGVWNPLSWRNNFGPVKRLRVLRDGTPDKRRASFLTLIATIGSDDRSENAITIGKGRRFEAHADGELHLFANDWPGGVEPSGPNRFRDPRKSGRKALPTYGNNNGHLKVVVTSLSKPR